MIHFGVVVHLVVLFTNAEESGLQGAKAFITNHTWRSNIHRFVNVDAVSCNEVASLIQIKPSQVFFRLYINLPVFAYFIF